MKTHLLSCTTATGWTAAWLLAAFLATPGCHRTSPAPQSVGVATAHLENWRSDDDYAKLSYPFISGEDAARLNPIIQRWVGSHCPISAENAPQPDSAAACVTAFSNACAALKHEYDDAGARPFGCTLDANTEIKLDAAGLLGIAYTTYSYTGGAHGSTVVSYLNLDLASGRVLTLKDLLDISDTAHLSGEIERAVRANRHIPATQSLKQAGFFEDTLPIPDTVLALPQGLLFTYQSYDVAPYASGLPQGLVPYSALGSMIRTEGVLPRLRALGESPAP